MDDDIPWSNAKSPPHTERRNTIERVIQLQENAMSDVIISDQQPELLTPGVTPLPAITNPDQTEMNERFTKKYAEILQKKAINYNESVVYNDADLQIINASGNDVAQLTDEYDTMRGYDDIYGQYGDALDANGHSKNQNGSFGSSKHSS